MSPDTIGALRARVHDRLLEQYPETLRSGSRWERRVRVREAVARVLAEERVPVDPSELAALVRELSDEITGLGPLEPLLADPEVTEVMVNGPRHVYVERAGTIERTAVTFADERAVRNCVDRIVAPLGLRIDESMPWVDARLADGSRVHAIIPPLSVHGTTITIRRFSRTPLDVEELVARGMLEETAASWLRDAVRARRNLIVSGGAGAGKTTLLGAIAAWIPAEERVVTIEDAAELRLQREHVIALETRPANVEGHGAVSMRDLVRNALRMRPDRIVVGEVRGAEALDMLHAMNTGHEGSMSTAHANGPADLLVRLEAMALMGSDALTVDSVRRQIGSALDVVVHVARTSAGRRVTAICEVQADLMIREVFSWQG